MSGSIAPVKQCPGCGRLIAAALPACHLCWQRAPTHVPGVPGSWRTARRAAVKFQRWIEVATVDAAVVAWLSDHQAKPRVR